MRLVVPVYNADGHAVAQRREGRRRRGSAKFEDVADAEPAKMSKKAKDKEKAKDKASAKADKSRPRTAEKSDVEGRLSESEEADDGRRRREPAKTADGQEAGDRQDADRQRRIRLRRSEGSAHRRAGRRRRARTPEFRWPARGRIIEGFKAGGNDGINISVPAGTSVRAAESGVVVYSGDGLKGYGNLVLIKHPNGFVTAYGNNGELDVKRGDKVKRGQIIAKSGDTGNVNSPQLHFELRKGSTPVDPTSYLAGL